MKRLLFLLVFSVLTGCGTGYYDKLYELHLKELESATRFAVLWPGGSDVPGTNLVIRLPKILEKFYNKNSIYSDDPHGEIDPERLNPPFLNPFPGLVNSSEVFQKDAAGANLPVYLYTGVRQLNPAGKAALQEELQAKLKAIAPEATWTDVQPPPTSPRGTPVPWKKIEAKMPQVFFPAGQGKAGAQTLPGEFQLWWYDTPSGVILLGWRAPESLVGQINLSNLAGLTAGTLDIKPDDVKPDDAGLQPAAAPDAAPADPAAAGDPAPAAN